MNSAILSGLIGAVSAVIIGSYISKKARKSEIEGVLCFGSFLIVLAWCCIAFVLLAVWAFFYDADAWEKPSELYPIIGLFVGFGAAAIYCFGEYFKVQGAFDSEGIDFYTPWTGRKCERWEDLVSVKFNSQANWYVLLFKSGKKIRLSSLLSGHGEVLKIVRSNGHYFQQG